VKIFCTIHITGDAVSGQNVKGQRHYSLAMQS